MPLPKLVGVTGFKRSGKDTFARVLVEEAGYVRVAFADALKGDVACNAGITVNELEKRKEEFRQVLKDRGMEMRRRYGDDYWIGRVKRAIRLVADHSSAGHVVISDVRFTNEADWVRSNGGVIVRQVRDGVWETDDEHPSEKQVDLIKPDHVIAMSSEEARVLAARELLEEWRRS